MDCVADRTAQLTVDQRALLWWVGASTLSTSAAFTVVVQVTTTIHFPGGTRLPIVYATLLIFGGFGAVAAISVWPRVGLSRIWLARFGVLLLVGVTVTYGLVIVGATVNRSPTGATPDVVVWLCATALTGAAAGAVSVLGATSLVQSATRRPTHPPWRVASIRAALISAASLFATAATSQRIQSWVSRPIVNHIYRDAAGRFALQFVRTLTIPFAIALLVVAHRLLRSATRKTLLEAHLDAARPEARAPQVEAAELLVLAAIALETIASVDVFVQTLRHSVSERSDTVSIVSRANSHGAMLTGAGAVVALILFAVLRNVRAGAAPLYLVGMLGAALSVIIIKVHPAVDWRVPTVLAGASGAVVAVAVFVLSVERLRLAQCAVVFAYIAMLSAIRVLGLITGDSSIGDGSAPFYSDRNRSDHRSAATLASLDDQRTSGEGIGLASLAVVVGQLRIA